MKTFIVFPDNAPDFMPINDMMKPAGEFSKLGCIIFTRETFFSDSSLLSSIKPEDNVVIYIGVKSEEHINILKNLNCNKFLRNVDPMKSDQILFRTELELNEKINFDAILVCIHSQPNLLHLKNKGINTISFPHALDFSKQRDPETVFKEKQAHTIISGQMHEKFYPVRWRLANYFQNNEDRFKSIFLPHPGYELSGLRHKYVGENYVNLVSTSWTGPVGTGHADGFHMKFLEFAKAYTLPIGNVPSYMDERARELVLQAGINESDLEMDNKITELFSNEEALKERILEYAAIIKENHCLKKTIKRVYDAICNKQYNE
jgi:hypothetical protein